MLTVLKIRNLALVEDLVWELGSGLICVTGETGAGKSVIVGALKLVLGERADRGLIRTGESSLTVEAVFELGNTAEVNAKLAESGLDPCEGDSLIIRRVVQASGGNQQFVNCSPATLTALKNIGELLVDLHGPHDHQSLLSNTRQMAMLDAYARAGSVVEAYTNAYSKWVTASRDLEHASTSERATAQEIDLLRYQVNDIDAAQLANLNEAELEQRYRTASSGQRLSEICAIAINRLSGNTPSVLSDLADISRQLSELERADPSAAAMVESFRSAQVELQEFNSSLTDYAENLELDPEAIAMLEDQVNQLENLKRKYGNTVADIIDFHAQAASRLELIENRSERIDALREEVESAAVAVQKHGAALSKLRAKAAPALAKEIAAQLEPLGFKQSQFELTLTPCEPSSHGIEGVDFQFAPNPGEPMKALRQVASSGEMSRVMLAIKSALANEDAIPLLVFDEIDANVGGEIASAVGKMMVNLGSSHQVISITHLPQVAALAQSHYFVHKEVKEGRTYSMLEHVTKDRRTKEIARMLGGTSASALAHAANLLKEGGAA